MIPDMRFARERIALFGSTAIILFAAVMVVRQVIQNQSRHAELREAFIFLHDKGYSTEAQHLYTKLLLNLEDEPTRHLVEDFQRTSLVAPTNQSPNTNVLVRYHRSIGKELGKRFEEEYLKARRLSEKGS